MSGIAEQKARLRARMIRERAAFHERHGARAGQELRARVLDEVMLPAGAVISGYWPLEGELDPRPLLELLRESGHPLALPRLDGDDRPLALHGWRPGDPLVPGRFKLQEPPATAPLVEPDVVLVPLVAFDRRGYRLGYGKGYYDRTLKALRAKRPVLAVGLAYAMQEVERLPAHEGDQRLDLVVTDEAVHDFRGDGS